MTIKIIIIVLLLALVLWWARLRHTVWKPIHADQIADPTEDEARAEFRASRLNRLKRGLVFWIITSALFLFFTGPWETVKAQLNATPTPIMTATPTVTRTPRPTNTPAARITSSPLAVSVSQTGTIHPDETQPTTAPQTIRVEVTRIVTVNKEIVKYVVTVVVVTVEIQVIVTATPELTGTATQTATSTPTPTNTEEILY